MSIERILGESRSRERISLMTSLVDLLELCYAILPKRVRWLLRLEMVRIEKLRWTNRFYHFVAALACEIVFWLD